MQLYVAPASEQMLAIAFGKIYDASIPTIVIFLYVSPVVEHVLAITFGNIYVGSSPTIAKFLCSPGS